VSLLKILQISKYYYPHFGGVENYIYTLSSELSKLNHNVTVVSSNDKFKLKTDNIGKVKVIRFPKIFEIFNAPVSFNLLFFPISNYDIIHLHLPNPFASLWILLSKKKNLVVTYHSDIIKFGFLKEVLSFLYTKLILVKLLRRTKKIIITSPNYLEGSPILQKFKQKVIVIPCCVDLSFFKLNKKNMKKLIQLKKKYKHKKIILFVGRLVPYKGLEYLLEAMKKVTQKFTNVKLLIIGNGPEKDKLKSLANSLDLNGFIDFLDEIKNVDLPLYYNLCGIFVLPSTYKAEAFGIAQLEAMACKKPVISTNIHGSGVPFVNIHGKTGLVVKPKSSQELANAISFLLTNENLRKKFGENAFKRVKNNFNKNIMVRRILDVYKLIDEPVGAYGKR